ncbi:uncharacterized protein LOC143217688 [Lasioglossum baleicum]|uniref:uncharacterized protein LOC143217688 n=1 Tax=Lasioglossum baleicum TaxID=434251 RepID=UPI003FCC70AC
MHVRLPKLTLPNFSEKYEDWVPFHNVYNSVIHESTALTIMQKFQYLRTAITGDAVGVIESLELSDENYNVAWNLLQERYNNTRVIVQTHIRKILELPVMTKENLLELRQIADGTAKHVCALTSLKRPADKWNDLLVYIITSKLDTVTVREWQNSLTGAELPTLHELLTFLQHRCQMLETNLKRTPALAPVSQNRQQATSYRHSSTHVATVNSKCAYCRGDHRIYSCSDFLKLPTEKRIAQVRRQKLCINCLRPSNHTSAQCNSRACQICNVKHNTLLHLSSKKRRRSRSRQFRKTPRCLSPK